MTKRAVFCGAIFVMLASAQQDWRKATGPVRVYNTAKKKLMEGKQIVESLFGFHQSFPPSSAAIRLCSGPSPTIPR